VRFLLFAALCLATLAAPAAALPPVHTPLTALTVAANTGEKPQSKVWTYAGKWWCVMPNSSGTWVWRLDGTAWTNVLQLSASTSVHADVKAVGAVSHVLLFNYGTSQLASIEYVPATQTYQFWTTRPANVSLPLVGGTETATLDVDSQGRMWLATDFAAATDQIVVYYSDAPYSSWSAPVTLATGINGDDISAVIAMPGGKIGVLWSNQNTQRFGFRTHLDGTDPASWTADELPASQSALNIGAGMADDHLNVAVASDGTLYAAVKTSYDTGGYPKMALLVRRPAGTWDNLYPVDQSGTRGIVLLDESAATVTIIYTSVEGAGNILYKESPTSAISMTGPSTVLIAGGLNDPTSTKQNISGSVVILAGSGTSLAGVLRSSGSTYTISASAGSGGSISPVGSVNVGSGASQSFAISATSGFHIADVLVDGASVGAVAGYTFTNVTAGHAIVASFASDAGPGDLVGWYRMDGDVTDASGNGFNATASGSPTYMTGMDGQALSLNGTSQFAYVPHNAAFSMTNALTLATWVNPAQEGTQNLLSKSTNGGIGGYELCLAATSSTWPHKAFFRLNQVPSADTYRINSTTNYSDHLNTWIHLAATYDGATMKLYVNGVLESSLPAAITIAGNTLPVGIGAQVDGSNAGTRWFRGGMDAARIYNRALSASEIAALASQAPTFTLTASAGANGSISPSGSVAVIQGANQAFAISANGGYHVADVLVDAVSVGAVAGYTFTNVQAAHAIVASFAADVQTFTISASAGANGSINPSGAVLVTQGANQAFAISADGGYHVADVLVDAVSVGAVTGYTFTNVQAAHAIVASFALDVPAGDLVGRWPMDEGSGTVVADVSTNGLNGTAMGSPAWVPGIDGPYALSFVNGTSQYVTVANAAPLNITSAITLSAWIRPTKVATASILNKATFNTSPKVFGYELDLSSLGVPFFRLFDDNLAAGGGRLNAIATYPTDGTTWMHVAGTYDGVTMKIYVNGVLNASKASTAPLTTNSLPFVIGATSDGLAARVFPGAIDDARIYNRALSASEVAALANAAATTHTLTASAGAGGGISPSGAVSVADGASQAFAITPAACYDIADVLVDGGSVGAVAGYTFTNVTADHTIAASFALRSYTIAASAGSNGSINPSGAVAVNCGTNQAFAISANSGYHVADVLVDAVSVGAVTGYTFSNVQAAHAISASFALDVPAGDMVARWTMDEGSGTVIHDATSYANDGTLIGSPAWVAGVSGQAVALNGGTQYASVPHSASLNISSALTLAVWIKPSMLATQPVIAKETYGTPVWGYALELSSVAPGRPFFRLDNNTPGSGRLDGVTAYPQDGNTWMHVAATYDGATMKLYINGVLDASQSRAISIPTNTLPLAIGAQSTGETGRWFRGAVDDARVYNRALSAAEIAALAAMTTHTITASAGAGGSISPSGVVSLHDGNNQAFTIAPAACYDITDVLVDGGSVGPVAGYTFTNVTADHTIAASFTLRSYTVTATAGSNGSISPSGAVVVNCGADGAFAISPAAGYHVLDVLVDHISVGAITAYTFTNVQFAHVISASFAPDAGPANLAGWWPLDEGSGSAVLDASGKGNNGTLPNGGSWVTGVHNLALSVNGTSQYASVPSSTSLDITGQITLAAWVRTTKVGTQNVIAKGLFGGTDGYELNLSSAAKPFLRLNGANRLDALTSYVPNTWTHVAATYDGITMKIYVNGVLDNSAATSITIKSNALALGIGGQSDGASARIFSGAIDDARVYDRALTASEIASLLNPAVTHTLTASAGAGGSISPSGSVGVNDGASQAFAITPAACYDIADVLVDGGSVGAVAGYTFTNVTADHTIAASFALKSYTITASAGSNGSISPSGAVAVNCGTNQAFAISASSGYHVADVLVDAVSVGAVAGYTFSNVQGAHTIAASFAITAHTLTASAGAGGAISPSGAVGVNDGANQAFAITPAACYDIADLLVDGGSVGAVAGYTFTNVTTDHTIAASFALKSYTITASAGSNGSINPSGAVAVNCGTNQAFAISAGSGYQVADVLVDAVSVGAVTGYTFSNVQGAHTIAASFASLTADIVGAQPASGTEITTLIPCVTVPVVITRTNPTPLRGYSVTLQLSPNLALCGAEFVSANYPRAPRSFHVTPASGNRWIIDDVTLGTPCGATGSGTLFSVSVTSPGTDGTGTITVESVQARDCSNQPIAVLPGPPATIPIHRMGPARTTNLSAVQVTTGNHVPPPAMHATTPIKLEFTLPAEAVSVEVYRKSFGGYPQYDENGGVEPTVPTYPLDGTWTPTAVNTSGQMDEPDARDFWYYVLVSKDAYGNASAVSNMTPGTLDYSLGDVSDGTTACAGNDLVASEDVSLLSTHYGATLPVNGALECLDVGPTVDYSVSARPRTDNKVDFEDLMMFSLNYSMVTALQTAERLAPAAATLDPSEQLGLWAPTLVTAGETFPVVLGLQGTGFLQGISVRLDWNPAVATPVSVTSGGLFEGVGGILFHVGLTTVDAALLGVRETGLAQGGAFATVMFQAVATGNPAIAVPEIKGRDRQNHPMDVAVVNAVGVDDAPVRTQFAPAMPTPFNSSTTLEFSLASRGEVELAVFSVDGRRVRTLVKGTQEPGVHRLAWNGTDDAGRQVAAGMYYARMIAGRERFTRTLIRLGR